MDVPDVVSPTHERVGRDLLEVFDVVEPFRL
jgi:hypothetical protein